MTHTAPTAMTEADLKAAFDNFDVPTGATGVRTIENNWVDNLTTANHPDFFDGADLHFAWDFSGTDDTAAAL